VNEEGGINHGPYFVTAKPKSDRLATLMANLRKNTYASMRPFGKTMTYSLENARLREDGYAIWEEEGYCSPPLAQERAAALDEFFDELNVTPVREGTGWQRIEELPRLFPPKEGEQQQQHTPDGAHADADREAQSQTKSMRTEEQPIVLLPERSCS
jgi:hypothetical protein